MKKIIQLALIFATCSVFGVVRTNEWQDIPPSTTIGTVVDLADKPGWGAATNISSVVVSNLVPSWAMATNPPQSGTDGEAVTNIVTGMAGETSFVGKTLMHSSVDNASFSTYGGWNDGMGDYEYKTWFGTGKWGSIVNFGGDGFEVDIERGTLTWTKGGVGNGVMRFPELSVIGRSSYDDYLVLAGDVPSIVTNTVTNVVTDAYVTNIILAKAEDTVDFGLPKTITYEDNIDYVYAVRYTNGEWEVESSGQYYDESASSVVQYDREWRGSEGGELTDKNATNLTFKLNGMWTQFTLNGAVVKGKNKWGLVTTNDLANISIDLGSVSNVVIGMAGETNWNGKALATTNALAAYLPLTGGTLTGNLTINGNTSSPMAVTVGNSIGGKISIDPNGIGGTASCLEIGSNAMAGKATVDPYGIKQECAWGPSKSNGFSFQNYGGTLRIGNYLADSEYMSSWIYYTFPTNGGVLALASQIPSTNGLAYMRNISPSDVVFSNAVLSVGLGIDTNTVAMLNEILIDAGESPVGAATTVGGLLAALAAAIAWLRKKKIDKLKCGTLSVEVGATSGEADVTTLFSSDNTLYNGSVMKISADADAQTIKAYIDAKLGNIETALQHVLGGN